MSETTIRIDKAVKKPIIRWQGWLQSKLGVEVTQSQAVTIACVLANSVMEEDLKIPIDELKENLSEDIARGMIRLREEISE